AGAVLSRELSVPLQKGVVGGAQVSRSPDEHRQFGGDGIQRLPRRLARRHLLSSLKLWDFLLPTRRQLAAGPFAPLFRNISVFLTEGSQPSFPFSLEFAAPFDRSTERRQRP